MPKGVKKACILKQINSTRNEDIIVLNICFLDDNDNPLLSGEFPHQVVYTLMLDEKLKNNFGHKDMMILG